MRTLRVETIAADPDCGLCDKLQQELLTVNDALREYKLLYEEVLPSKNDELTCSLVEPFIRVVDGRYEMVAREGIELFESRGFKLRKWVTNGHAKSVLRQVPQCDHAPSIGKIDIGSQPLPDSTALGLSWDPESDTLKISGRTFVEAATRREMARSACESI